MATLRRFFGAALLAAGIAVGVFAFRSAAGDDAQAEAAVRATAGKEAAAERFESERRAMETRVKDAVAVRPLESALEDRVDGPTLLDLFENEDWWRPYRADLPLVRVIVGGSMLASRGAPANATFDTALVKAARAQKVASSIVTVGTQTYLLAAARIATLGDREPVLVIGRPIARPPETPVATPIPAAPPAKRQLPWLVAGGAALLGLGLMLARGKAPPAAAPVAAAVEAVITHEPTSKFGTPARPRPRVGANAGTGAGPVQTPTASRGRIVDGGAVSIPPVPAVSPPAPLTSNASLPAVSAGAPPPPPPAPVTAPGGHPATFGRYRLIDRLGEGGMSELFVAEAAGAEGFSRTFVLKRMRPELAHDKEAVAQFIDEARMQATLVHSNIVPVFDFGVVGNEYFMTQEYIAGRDLGRIMDRLQQQGQIGLPPHMAYYIAHEVLNALSYAHDMHDRDGSPMGIVHRDVSASNIMASLLGEVKLADFGIVKSNRRVTKTQVGMVKGNANFMSPEQARGHAVDGRSDLFSLALVLYFCLTGELVYSGTNDLEVLYRAATGLTAEDLERLRMLPDPASSVLEKALAVDPAERFQTANEFADALAAHIGGGKTALAKLINQLFGGEIRRFAA